MNSRGQEANIGLMAEEVKSVAQEHNTVTWTSASIQTASLLSFQLGYHLSYVLFKYILPLIINLSYKPTPDMVKLMKT